MSRDFGPNGLLVERFLARLAHLTLTDFGEAVRTWRDQLRRTDVWHAAEDAVGDAITLTGRHDGHWALQDRLYQLFRASSWHAPRSPGGETEGTEAAAMYLATSAGVALLVADALTSAELRTLYAPFARLVPLAQLAVPTLDAGALPTSAPD